MINSNITILYITFLAGHSLGRELIVFYLKQYMSCIVYVYYIVMSYTEYSIVMTGLIGLAGNCFLGAGETNYTNNIRKLEQTFEISQ